MDRGTRIAKALGRGHDKLRAIFNQEQCLKLLEGDQNDWGEPTATYDSHWYLDRREYTELSTGKKFKRVVIDDVEGCRKTKLKSATAAQIGDMIYRFASKDSLTGGVPSYEFKVYPVGERI